MPSFRRIRLLYIVLGMLLVVGLVPLTLAGWTLSGRSAEELRAKESDRIESTTEALRAVGSHIRATDDGFRIRGVPTRIRGGVVDSRGDHRIAMLGAIAGLVSSEGVEIEDAESVAVSFPGFFDLLDSLRATSVSA